MEHTLQKILRDEEKVLWFGRPARSRLLCAPDKIRQCIAWGVAVVMAALTFGLFIPYAIRMEQELGLILIALGPLVFLPLAVAIRPYLDKKLLERDTIYAVTDQRVIAVVKDNVMIMPRDRRLACAVEGREGDSGNICFNSAIGQDVKKSRANAVIGFRKDNGKVTGLLFFHVSDPDTVLRVLA